MRHYINTFIMTLALLVASTTGAWAYIGATDPHMEVVSGPTYDDNGGKSITLRLWVWNYDGDNAYYVSSPTLYIDNMATNVRPGVMWSTMLTTNEDNIKSYTNEGNVGNAVNITMNDVVYGTAQLKNVQKQQHQGHNHSNGDGADGKWTTVDLELNFNSNFSYGRHTLNLEGPWLDRCDDGSNVPVNQSVTATMTGVYGVILPDGLTVTGGATPKVCYDDVNYYASNSTVTISTDKYHFIKSLNATGAVDLMMGGDERSAIITVGTSDITVTATLITVGGTCGNGLEWSIEDTDYDGTYETLNIFGTGTMDDYLGNKDAPWYADYHSNITTVNIDDGVSYLGAYAFNKCTAISRITLPETVSSIGSGCFGACIRLVRLTILRTAGVVTLGYNAFGIQNIVPLTEGIVVPTPDLALQYATADNWTDYASKLRTEFGGQLFGATNEGGTAAYAIATADDLRHLATAVNSGNESSGKTFRQTADITFSHPDNEDDDYEENYEAIGQVYSISSIFKGHYDGGGYTISGIRIRKPDLDNGDEQALFGQVAFAYIHDIHLTDARITGYDCAGGIVGIGENSTVSGCTVTESAFTAPNYWGTICGYNMFGNTYVNNYYHGCTVNGTAVTSGVGTGYDGDITENDGAVPVPPLSDNADNTTVITVLNSVHNLDITLQGRKLWKDGAWNTLCLPFSLTATQIADSPLAGADIRELDVDGDYSGKHTGLDGTTLYLYFKTATSIEAGKPYIVKWDATEPNYVENPVFQGVTIDKTNNDVTFTGGAFKGNYDMLAWTAETPSILYLGSNNRLYWPQPTGGNAVNLGACRAYFELSDGQSAHELVLSVETTTGITNTDFTDYTDRDSSDSYNSCSENNAWYTLDGRKLSGKPTTKGVYIHDGRKMVVKEFLINF